MNAIDRAISTVPAKTIEKPLEMFKMGEISNMSTATAIEPAPLTHSTSKGNRYKRSGAVDAEIRSTLPLPHSAWVQQAKKLRSETLVFLIRQTHRTDEFVCGALLETLRTRIDGRARSFVAGLDKLAVEQILMNVEMKLLEGILTALSSRVADYLEVAFAQAIERFTISEIRKHSNTPFGKRGEVILDLDEDGEEIERPLEEFVADRKPWPGEIHLNLQADNQRHQLLKKACEAVTNPDGLQAVIFHHAHGVPVTSKSEPSLQSLFPDSTPRQIRYWIATALQEMRDAVGVARRASPPGAVARVPQTANRA